MSEQMQASFSVLIMSLASSSLMAMGLAPDPQTGQTSKDKELARFNVDLLMVLQEKTKGNLSSDEASFLENLIKDLQIKYISI